MQDKNHSQEQNREVAKELTFTGAMLGGMLLIFPIMIFGIPIFLLTRLITKESIHLILAVAGVGLAAIGFIVEPTSYFGLYSIIPFDMSWLSNLLNTSFSLSIWSFLIYTGAGLIFSYGYGLYTKVIRSKKVGSDEEARDTFLASSQYKRVKKNKDEINRKVQEKWRKEGSFSKVLLGIDEKGKAVEIDFKEINQHHFISATTGGGKTIYLLIYVEYAMANNYPMIFIDGKGSLETIEEVRQVTNAYGKELKVFSDTSDLTYNPLRYGNATVITDKLKQLVETESKYYTEISTSLVQAIIQFIDDYGFKRDLQTFATYLNPSAIEKVIYADVEEMEVEIEGSDNEAFKRKSFRGLNKKTKNDSELKEENASEEKQEFVEEKPMTEKVQKLTERAKKHLDRIFQRYEGTDEGKMYLFANASSVRTQIYLLLDSELGHLFEDKEDGLDLLSMSDNKEAVFISFDGNIYDEYIKKIARFLILDINYLVSVRNRTGQKGSPLLAVYDEFGVYANEKIVDTVNKSRSAGFHCCIATQLIADLEKISPTLPKQIIGNTNTYAIGHTNLPEEVESWSNQFGTKKDNDMTTTTESKGSLHRREMKKDAGTVRKVHKFRVSPDEIKGLRKGQFVIERKATEDESVIPKIVYVRHPLVGLEEGRNLNEQAHSSMEEQKS